MSNENGACVSRAASGLGGKERGSSDDSVVAERGRSLVGEASYRGGEWVNVAG